MTTECPLMLIINSYLIIVKGVSNEVHVGSSVKCTFREGTEGGRNEVEEEVQGRVQG